MKFVSVNMILMKLTTHLKRIRKMEKLLINELKEYTKKHNLPYIDALELISVLNSHIDWLDDYIAKWDKTHDLEFNEEQLLTLLKEHRGRS